MKLSHKEFEELRDYIYSNFGIHMSNEKKFLCETRLTPILESRNISSFEEYMKILKTGGNKEDLISFINKITTNHTYFYREEKHFEYLAGHVLGELKHHIKDNDLRIWSAGCSSGEEPYTIEMILQDYFSYDKIHWDTKILATDISNNVLALAKEGIYSYSQINKLPPHMIKRYFEKVGNEEYRVIKPIRDDIIFRVFNLNNEFPFKKNFHVIFCRNVMIYFDKESKRKLIKRFSDHLVNGGYLFIGHSETIEKGTTDLEYVMPAVYRKVIK